MNKSRNLCYETNPDEIVDIMNGCEGISLSDCIEAIIGLGKIAANQKAQIKVLQKNLETCEQIIKKLQFKILTE